MNYKNLLFGVITASFVIASCQSNSSHAVKSNGADTSKIVAEKDTFSFPGIKTDSVTYEVNGKKYAGFVAYKADQDGKRPAIVVVDEWWGLTGYGKRRAEQLANLGYIAMAADMYGGGEIAEDPGEAQKLAAPYYKSPALAKTQIDAVLNFLKKYPQTDTSQMAAIGYCFGGYVVLNAAKLGSDLKGVVTFHGGLEGAKPVKGALKAKLLICQGGADDFENPHLPEFKKEMDSVGADYTVKVYPGATHAFSNPEATELGKKFNMPIRYDAAADAASWNDMKVFFKNLFGSGK